MNILDHLEFLHSIEL